jgi:hypothetical protein
MQQISSRLTGFYKWTLPMFWFGILAISTTSVLFARPDQPRLIFLLVPFGLSLVGYAMAKRLYWKLADRVYDCGDYLMVKKGRDEERIQLAEIAGVEKSLLTNPQRITLRLVRPHKLGSAIAFAPVTPLTFNPFAKNRVVEDLITRVARARQA